MSKILLKDGVSLIIRFVRKFLEKELTGQLTESKLRKSYNLLKRIMGDYHNT